VSDDPREHVRQYFCALTDYEECGTVSLCLKRLDDLVRKSKAWAIIERERNRTRARLAS
jgi:hypothetical protein